VCFEAGAELLPWEQQITLFPEWPTLLPQEQRLFSFTRIFAGVEALPRAVDVLDVINSWHPAVLINEVAELGGPLAAARSQLPHVTVGYGPPVQAEVLAATDSVLRAHWASWGMEPATPCGLYDLLYLDPCPPSLQPTDSVVIPNRHGIRPGLGPPAGEASAAVMRRLPSEAVLYLTMGTVFGRDAALFREVITGLAEIGRPAVVTLGPHVTPSEIGRTWPNVFVLPFLAQSAILPRCDLVVTHGGAGSMLGALALGVPLLLLPRGADHFYNADRVVAAGAGRQVEPAAVSAETVAREARLLLSNPGYRVAARRIQAEIESMPSPAEVAELIADLAKSRG